MSKAGSNRTGLEIAVIGMSGRFPGAGDIDTFWENLKNGVEAIVFFTGSELEENGAGSRLSQDSNYVKANGILAGIDYFDSDFFGYTPREAEIMDPQFRLFHECAWSALENAGYSSQVYDGLIGLFAGASSNFFWEAAVQLSGKANEIGQYSASQLMNKDFLCVRLSYKLNLKGPAVIVQSACSTSLVAIHLACQAILNGECDMALAGGVTIIQLRKRGYIYRDGMIFSPDGHCRAFDERARGTVSGNGAGIVVLKRLEEAVADGDYIYALVKGSAVNNDGIRKIGFTAPSIEGQVDVIMTAHEVAEVEPESISFIETHGTGTSLGDPVEINALEQAFNSDKKGFCAIGSVKTNLGHLDCAAGVAGFIKVVLALHHRSIPPSLHFENPNPKIDFANSPFYVNTTLKEWKNETYPLRAGVSSFGIGGTNAHVILEEAPGISGAVGQWVSESVKKAPEGTRGLAPLSNRQYQLILLSAKTESALDKMTGNLAEHIKENPGINLADVSYTLQVGRQAFPHRRVCTASTVDQVIEILSSPQSGSLHTFVSGDKNENQPVIFMFPGQGAQYVNMGQGVYETESVFKKEMDRCFDILKPLTDHDLKEILYPDSRHYRSNKSYNTNSSPINQTEIAQPLLFAFEYALAKLLMTWGIEPYAMIGHSIGEYTAACLSGVFSLEDALKLVVMRGKGMQRMPSGAMSAVPLPEEEVLDLLESNKELSLAAVNSTSLCTVSGPLEAVAAFEKESANQCRRLHTSHAFHSRMMEPLVKEFEAEVARVRLHPPKLPYISNITGTWISVEEAVAPGYWASHIRGTVRFAPGLTELLKEDNTVFVEVGPGQNLSTLVRKHAQKKPGHLLVNLVKHPRQEIDDAHYLLTQLGRLWLYGQAIDWPTFHSQRQQKGNPGRIPLPTYPFAGFHYPFFSSGATFKTKEIKGISGGTLPRKTGDIGDWFYVPLWKQSPFPTFPAVKTSAPFTWLVFMDERGLGNRLAKRLQQQGHQVITVRPGPGFEKIKASEYVICPREPGDYDRLLNQVCLQTPNSNKKMPQRFVHLWGVTGSADQKEKGENQILDDDVDMMLESGFYSLVYLAQAMGKQKIEEPLHITVVTDNMQPVTGEEVLCPGKAAVLGAVKVIPLEYHFIRCRSIDIVLPSGGSPREQRLIAQLETELLNPAADDLLAFRGQHRWVQIFEPVKLEKPPQESLPLRKGGVYLVTGGLGGIGLELAQYLAKTVQPRLILTTRSTFPGKEQWQQWLDSHPKDHPVSWKIQKLREIRDLGAEVIVARADAADEKQMQEVMARANAQFGPINGVIHSAGVADGRIIQQRTREITAPVLAPKIKGTLVLDRLLRNQPGEIDVMVQCSSLSSILAGIGQAGYCAANAFLDAFSHYKNSNEKGNKKVFVTINWDTWKEVGMAVDAARQQPGAIKRNIDYESALKNGMSSNEGVEVFERLLAAGYGNVAVSTRDLNFLIEAASTAALTPGAGDARPGPSTPRQKRPGLSTPYTAPRDKTEKQLAETWENFLAMDKIGIHDNFFELGASSLDIVQVNGQLEKIFNTQIPVVTMFTYPTVDELKRYLDRENQPGSFSQEEIARLEKINHTQKNRLIQRKRNIKQQQEE